MAVKCNTMKACLFIIVCVVCGVLLAAETNYLMAVNAAENCEGTDLAIEETMSEYGFSVDAFDDEPSMSAKVTALRNTLL